MISRPARIGSHRAFSLMELVFAAFIMLTGFTLVATLVQQSLGHQATVEENIRAANFANNVLADIRREASDYAFFKNDDWSSFALIKDPLASDLEARVTVEPADLAAPCTNLEERWPPGERRLMVGTMKTATIKIFNQTGEIFSLGAYIPAPEGRVRFSNPVLVTPLAGSVASLAKDEETEFTAKLFDKDGDEIPGVEFSFQVNPVDGNATALPSRAAPQATVLKNVYLRSNGTRIYTGGSVKVRATAVYFGNQYQGESEEITLLR
jgi:type II secretory pathway pseudopilin PulG